MRAPPCSGVGARLMCVAKDPIHPPGTIEEALPKSKHLGPVDMATVEKVELDEVKSVGAALPTLAGCLNLDDFEARRSGIQSLDSKANGLRVGSGPLRSS